MISCYLLANGDSNSKPFPMCISKLQQGIFESVSKARYGFKFSLTHYVLDYGRQDKDYGRDKTPRKTVCIRKGLDDRATIEEKIVW